MWVISNQGKWWEMGMKENEAWFVTNKVREGGYVEADNKKRHGGESGG